MYPEMTADEILLLKCFDSNRWARPLCQPHGAFVDPTTLRRALRRAESHRVTHAGVPCPLVPVMVVRRSAVRRRPPRCISNMSTIGNGG